ncbi:MAG: phosphoenolpyruvate synthase [Bacteroidales bacterium]|nr:phosphoenolpyruvate synthase [Bacteroidales bacterium]MCF8327690.1 phosphoenolpyruvate synthase [Bacteroidales bacterium]
MNEQDYLNYRPEKQYYFSDTSFDLLMRKRISKILLICSTYDAFMLEEDGRIDEQIFNEYVSLNLRYPPQFIQVSSAEEAWKVLEEEQIDLVISMLSIGDMDPFQMSISIKDKYPDIPIVVLTPFSREVTIKLKNEDLSAIDHVFCWLGNANILLAIIKLIEDSMNVQHDVEEVGVQVIILVEDNIRFYSSYLPNIYRIIFKQSKKFMAEGLNEHQKMLRMRGRPKILLARTYEQAIDYYEKYKHNLLGIISDISYYRNDKMDKFAGVRLCRKVRKDDKFLPFLLQSSDGTNEKLAKRERVGFINKNSKTLLKELRDYIVQNFAFGDFIFLDPTTGEEIDRATDLQSFQQKIYTIPDKTLSYHINRNHISKWLNARALFPIAEMLKYLRPEHFDNLDQIRKFLFDTIASYRRGKGRGVIAKFYRERFDEYLIFSRIGEGSIGGKARGLAFIDSLLKKHNLMDKYEDVIITIPRTVVLSTDVFDEFMDDNELYDIALSDISDDEILDHFINARLPFRIHKDLLAFIEVVHNPIAIRSSSLLEDSHYQPFAGIYSTYMVPKIEDDERLMLELLGNAIKSVYASVFYKDSKAYMEATSNVIDEEKMGIVLQEVCGKEKKSLDNLFSPTFSGVARSINFYPIEPEKSEDGIASIAVGLGKYIVDGGQTLRFSPKYPKKVLQLSNPDMALRDTQKYFYALDLKSDSFQPSVDDAVNLEKVKIKDIADSHDFKHVFSTFDYANNVIRDGANYKGKKIVTFANVLKHKKFPLAEILQDILEIGQKAMNNPIEIEFAVNMDTPKDHPMIFSMLQIRPIVENKEELDLDLEEDVKEEDTIIYSNSALGNGEIDYLKDIVYVKPDSFQAANNPQIAEIIERLNIQFKEQAKNYILIGPGRWGSNDPWLGVPVKWAQISQARLIVESGLENYRIDPSQGTHFFQNLTSFQVGYFTINPHENDGYYDVDYLNQQEAVYEDDFVRHVQFENPVVVKIDGRKNKGVIFRDQVNE